MAGVSFQILVDGAPIPADLLARLQDVEVEDHAEMASMARLRFSIAVAEDGNTWAVVDDDPFPRLHPIKVLAAVDGESMEPLLEAYVMETSIQFSDQPGESTLEVVAMDGSILLDLEEKVRAWPDMSDSDIASAIFSEAGLAADVDDTQPVRSSDDVLVVQRGTDMQFLRHLAQRNGYDCYIESDPDTGAATGHFHPPRVDEEAQGILTFNAGEASNVVSIQARQHLLKPSKAETGGVDDSSIDALSASIDETALDILGKTALDNSTNPRTILLGQSALDSAQELETLAQAHVDRSAWAIEATGELDTIRYGKVLRAKRLVKLRGIGQRFSGTYRVEQVQHRLAEGTYTQNFTLRRNALEVPLTEVFTEGLLP